MGFYCQSRASAHDGPVITPREYIGLLGGAASMVAAGALQGTDTYRPGVADAAATSILLDRLSLQARRYPGDPTTHRRLGIAHLAAGSCKPAVRHLQIAVNILYAKATTGGCLQQSLCARLELALLLPVLPPLCRQLGKRDTASRLVSHVLLAW